MAQRIPTIGINTSFEINESGKDVSIIRPPYWQRILEAGGLPMLMPQLEEPRLIDAFLDRVDGFLMIGGADISAARLGVAPHPAAVPLHPRRERCDFLLLERLLARRVPTLGICLACQEINVIHGGTMYQDLPTEGPPGVLTHASKTNPPPFHPVTLAPGTILHAVVGSTEFDVNSYHHQAARELGSGLRRSAWTPDGITEGLEVAGLPFFIGVQWHPERMPKYPSTRKLFAALVENAVKSRHQG